MFLATQWKLFIPNEMKMLPFCMIWAKMSQGNISECIADVLYYQYTGNGNEHKKQDFNKRATCTYKIRSKEVDKMIRMVFLYNYSGKKVHKFFPYQNNLMAFTQ